MTTENRLAKSEKVLRGSALTAAEYATQAEANGDKHKAKLWWEAHRNGWDAQNYDPEAAAEHWHKINEKRAGWRGGKMYGAAPKYRGEIINPSEARHGE